MDSRAANHLLSQGSLEFFPLPVFRSVSVCSVPSVVQRMYARKQDSDKERCEEDAALPSARTTVRPQVATGNRELRTANCV